MPEPRPLQEVLDEYMAELRKTRCTCAPNPTNITIHTRACPASPDRTGVAQAVKCGKVEPHDGHNWGIRNRLVCDGRGLAADDHRVKFRLSERGEDSRARTQVEPGAGISAVTGEECC